MEDVVPERTRRGPGPHGGEPGARKTAADSRRRTLREAARTPPYMHDGSLATLDDVIDFYDKGGRANPQLDPEIRPLHLSVEEKSALKAFLTALLAKVHDGF